MSDDLLPDLLTAVEQQLHSPETPYVANTFRRLLESGLTETAAKEQIAFCLGEEMDRVLHKRRGFDAAAYRAALDALPADPED